MFALGKSFAIIKVSFHNIPLFVTEAVLFFLLITLVIPRLLKGKSSFAKKVSFYLVLLYLLLGAVNLLRGFSTYKMFALRDSAIVYYSLFIFVVLEVFTDMKKFRVLIRILLLSGIIGLAIGIICFSGYRLSNLPYLKHMKFDPLSMYYSFLMIGIFCLYPFVRTNKTKVLLVILFCIAFVEVIIFGYRSAWLGLIGAFSFIFFKMKGEKYRIISKFAASTFIILPLLVILIGASLYLQQGKFDYFLSKAAWLFHPTTKRTVAADTVNWRLELWKQAIVKGSESHLLFGSGFGKGFEFTGRIAGVYLAQVTGFGVESRITFPHNGYVTIFYKMGIVGIVSFLVINLHFFLKGLKFLKRRTDPFKKHLMLTILACFIFWNIMSCFFVVLECPHMGIFLWIIIGLGASLIRVDNKEKLLR